MPASDTFLLSPSPVSPRIFPLSNSNHVQPGTLFLVETAAFSEMGTQKSRSNLLRSYLESNEDVTVEINGDRE